MLGLLRRRGSLRLTPAAPRHARSTPPPPPPPPLVAAAALPAHRGRAGAAWRRSSCERFWFSCQIVEEAKGFNFLRLSSLSVPPFIFEPIQSLTIILQRSTGCVNYDETWLWRCRAALCAGVGAAGRSAGPASRRAAGGAGSGRALRGWGWSVQETRKGRAGNLWAVVEIAGAADAFIVVWLYRSPSE
ncbi:hypothetical protein B484DRAFT_253534 [Ochromonadaceae sp. CCMP2298]|nr:hypothetical protein B484DRAFT_253534 [Ochromonadaceae sp. CCMP2298]